MKYLKNFPIHSENIFNELICFNISVIGLLEIKEGPHDIQVSWGGTAVFTCKVQDTSASVIWMRDDKEVIPDDYKYKINDDGSLMIQNTEDTDSGYYECIVKNVQGEVKSRPARMIVVKPEYTTPSYGELKLLN